MKQTAVVQWQPYRKLYRLFVSIDNKWQPVNAFSFTPHVPTSTDVEAAKLAAIQHGCIVHNVRSI